MPYTIIPTNLVSIHSSYGNSVSKMYLKPD